MRVFCHCFTVAYNHFSYCRVGVKLTEEMVSALGQWANKQDGFRVRKNHLFAV